MAFLLTEDQYVSLSALRHYAMCPRRCALIHTDQEWEENVLTAMGRIEHERVHTGPSSAKDGVHTARGLPLVSHRWGITGFSDAVEYVQTPTETRIIPIEYKHGRKGKEKEHTADCIQLCAQVLCLEEMNQCRIPAGYLYYRGIRRRMKVAMDETIRNLTIQTIEATRSLLDSDALPPANKQEHCAACSLVDICLPTTRKHSVAEYNKQQIAASLAISSEE